MSKAVIRIVILALVSFATIKGVGQTKSDLIRYGDEAYKAGNYASAAYFYKKVVTISNAGLKETVYPYDLKHSNRDFDAEKGDQVDSLSTDSLLTDSIIMIDEPEYVYDSTGVHLALTVREMEYGELLHKLGDSYRLDHNYVPAEEWMEKAVKYHNDKFPLAKFHYGNVLLNNEKYEEARTVFSEFITETINEEYSAVREIAKKKMSSCSYAIKKANPVPGIQVWQADTSLNSGFSNFSANYFGNEEDLVFASSKPEGDASSEEKGYSCDLYLAKGGGKERFDQIEALPAPIKSAFSEASAIMHKNGERIYFTHWEEEICAIYYCNNFQGQWMQPWMMNNINRDGYKTMNPTLSKDGKVLYFSSNMPGGQGGMDIWYCTLDRWGDATEPVNMGPAINTPGDEITPFIHPRSGALYFSSNGLVGFGGFDIYVSKHDEDYGWMRPINLDKPINSSKDDAYYIMDSDGKTGYFSSDRINCDACNHGNCMKIFKYDKGLPSFFLDGIVFNSETDEIIPNAKITIKDVQEDTVMVEMYADEEGYYSMQLSVDMIYFIKGTKPRFFADANSASTMGYTESQSFMRDLYLTPMPDEEIELPGIEYDYDKATLRPASLVVLDKLLGFLQLNDNLVVEIRSHTDSRGSDEYNQKLSQARAQSCVDYLISKGIPEERMVATGYGESKPKVPNAQTEEDHQRNRRTAFAVIGQDFHIESDNQ